MKLSKRRQRSKRKQRSKRNNVKKTYRLYQGGRYKKKRHTRKNIKSYKGGSETPDRQPPVPDRRPPVPDRRPPVPGQQKLERELVECEGKLAECEGNLEAAREVERRLRAELVINQHRPDELRSSRNAASGPPIAGSVEAEGMLLAAGVGRRG